MFCVYQKNIMIDIERYIFKNVDCKRTNMKTSDYQDEPSDSVSSQERYKIGTLSTAEVSSVKEATWQLTQRLEVKMV